MVKNYFYLLGVFTNSFVFWMAFTRKEIPTRKMKFGKLADIESVDFTLPSSPAGTSKVLKEAGGKNRQLQFYIGCTGWSMKEWLGKVYPKNAKSKDYLKYYSEQFNTIELNTTHYRIPTVSTIEKWYTEATSDFKFCPKIPQSISHSRNLGMGTGKVLEFCESIQGLKEKLGCCFMQLPPYFGKDRLETLHQFIRQFPSHIPLAIEVRHDSWFRDSDDSESLFELLEKYNIATVITDVAGRRDVLHMRLSNTTAMIRFVGNGLHPTDYSRIRDWVNCLKGWQEEGLSEVYFFTHEPDNVLAPDLAAYLFSQLHPNDHMISRGPTFISEKEEGQQMSLF